MNIFEKLQKVRVELSKSDLKKTGNNKFAGYKYYELGDFLPQAMELMEKNKLSSHVSFTEELATLTIVNMEKSDETVVFTSPMKEANLKGCHPVQNLGAVQTYQRRYLYTMAFEIVESDALDATTGNNNQNTKKEILRATKDEINEFVKAYRDKGITDEQMKEKLKGKSLQGITKENLKRCYALIK